MFFECLSWCLKNATDIVVENGLQLITITKHTFKFNSFNFILP